MLFYKFIILLAAIVCVKSSPPKTVRPILQKTLTADYFQQISKTNNFNNINGTAVVLKSNLPIAVQSMLAADLTSIYQRTSDELQRAQQFQTVLMNTYTLYWSVVINFDVISFYSSYYILLQINADRVLGFGYL